MSKIKIVENPSTSPFDVTHKAKENAEKWTHQLAFYNCSLEVERKFQAAAYNKLASVEEDLKKLNTDTPSNALKIQQNALSIALKSSAKTKNKTVIGTIETIAISATACALSLTALRFAFTDVFLALASFKLPAMSALSSIIGSSGYLGWKAEKKASLSAKMADDNVKAAKTAVNKCRIRCQDHAKQLQTKKAEKTAALQEFENANTAVQALTDKINLTKFHLSQANKILNPKDKMSGYKNTTFAANVTAEANSDVFESPQLERPGLR